MKIILLLFFIYKIKTQCYLSLLNSFKLEGNIRPKENKSKICIYKGKNCCNKDSDKLIQIWWTRVSNPIIKYKYKISYYHLRKSIDNIINSLKFFTYIKSFPLKETYSIECLKVQNNLYKISNKSYINKLYYFKNTIKNMYYELHKLKREFYCDICIYDYQKEFNLKKKTININYSFCYTLIKKFFNYSFFINIELNKLMNNIQKFYLCFLFKNIENNKRNDFNTSSSIKNNLMKCKKGWHDISNFDLKNCTNYCKGFSLIKDKHNIIGSKSNFIKFNKFYRFIKIHFKKYFKINLNFDKLKKEEKLDYKKNLKYLFNSSNLNMDSLSLKIKNKYNKIFNSIILEKTTNINKYLKNNSYTTNESNDIFLKNKWINLNLEKFKIKFSNTSSYDPFNNNNINNLYYTDNTFNYLIDYKNYNFKNITTLNSNKIIEKILNKTVEIPKSNEKFSKLDKDSKFINIKKSKKIIKKKYFEIILIINFYLIFLL